MCVTTNSNVLEGRGAFENRRVTTFGSVFPLRVLRESTTRRKEVVEKLGVQYLEIATVTRNVESQQVTRLVDRQLSVLNKRALCLPSASEPSPHQTSALDS